MYDQRSLGLCAPKERFIYIYYYFFFWSMQVLVSGVLVFRIRYHDSRCEILLKRDKNMSIVFFILISRDLYQKLMNTN